MEHEIRHGSTFSSHLRWRRLLWAVLALGCGGHGAMPPASAVDAAFPGIPDAAEVPPDAAVLDAPAAHVSLDVTVTGLGSVTSQPAGIGCPTHCSAAFDPGTHVILTATAFPGNRFAGWDGDCHGTGPCELVLDVSHAVSASFAPLSTGFPASYGGPGPDSVEAIAVDNSGNILIAGRFSATASFGGIPLTTAGSDDAFVAKVSPAGVTVWVTAIGGPGSDEAHGIAIAPDGTIVVVGQVSDGAVAGTTTVHSAGGLDGFIAKLDGDGTVTSIKTIGGPSDDTIRGVAIDGTGHLVITGAFAGSVDFGSGPHTANNSADAFVAEYDSSGALTWVFPFGAFGGDSGTGIAVAKGTDDVVAVGSTLSSVQIPSQFDPHSTVFGGPYVIRFTKTGIVEWVLNDYANAVATDSLGNAVFVGSVTLPSGQGGLDVALGKRTPKGNSVFSRLPLGGPGDDIATTVAVDADDFIWVAGTFHQSATFPQSGGAAVVSSGGADVFVAKFDAAGGFVTAVSLGGSSDDEALGVAAGPGGRVYVGGDYRGTATFGAAQATSVGDADGFLFQVAP